MKHTDEEVVRVLAGREGWKWTGNLFAKKVNGEPHICLRFNYLHSRDALAPVLAELSAEEWQRLISRLDVDCGLGIDMRLSPERWTKWLLTLPPSDLARAIAEAISK